MEIVFIFIFRKKVIGTEQVMIPKSNTLREMRNHVLWIHEFSTLLQSDCRKLMGRLTGIPRKSQLRPKIENKLMSLSVVSPNFNIR